MQLRVNGKERDVPAPCSLIELLTSFEINPQLVAVERNGEIVKRDGFAEMSLAEGDVLEIVHMVGGG